MSNNIAMPDEVVTRGVMENGYGIMPKMVMQGPRLTIEAKAIYAYIASFAGAGTTAFPGRAKMAADLKIGEERLYKHRKLLIKCGYISIEQQRGSNGLLGKTVYTLEPIISENPFTEEPFTENRCADNKGHNNNSIKINSLNNNRESKPVRHKYGRYKNVLLSDKDMEALKAEFSADWEARIERLSEYIESSGKSYKSHLATIRSWARRDEEKKKPAKPVNRYSNIDEEETL